MAIGASLFVLETISETRLSKYFNQEIETPKTENIKFEEGGLLKVDEFDFFRAFSNDIKFSEIIYKNLENIDKNVLEIKNSFQLENMRRNDCERNRCIQYEINFSKIPNILSRGLISIEDFRYLDHFGVDVISIFRAVVKDIQAGALVQGGSTITQQLVKNLLFTNERNFIRKIKEAILAIYVEYKYEKTQILQLYFNEVYWGSINGINVKGIQAAAIMYFGKDIELLEEFEASILVSMLKGPSYYHPIRHTERLKERANFIFNKLKKAGLFTSNSWNENQWIKWVERLRKIENRNIAEVMYILSSQEPGSETYLFYKLLLSSKDILEKNKDNKDLSVKLILTKDGREYRYYSRFERDIVKALEEEKQQIGSIIKPLIYALAQRHGVKLSDEITTEPITLKLKSGDWSPRESHKVQIENITLEKALQDSLNNPLIRMATTIGIENLENDLLEIFETLKTPLKEYPAQLLGAIEVPMEKINLEYLKFYKKECEKEDSEILNALSDFSKTTVKRVIHKNLLDFKIFGKTGTTNNGYDNWYVGNDGKISIIIWTGVEGSRNEDNKLSLYGSNTSFVIFQDGLIYSGRRPGASLCGK